MFGCMAGSLNTIRPDAIDTPRLAQDADDAGMASDAPGGADTGSSATAAAYHGSGNATVLDRHGDGHFYAKVEINGTAIEMLVDTGASGVALSENDARRVGLATSIGMRDHVGEGAGGAVYGDVVEIERIRLGDVEVNDIQGVVLKGGNMSLLGQSFLAKFGKVEISGDRMILRS